MNLRKIFLLPFVTMFSISTILAHCPLCVVGAGAAAGAAMWLGVSKIVVGLFIGAFAMSMGMWFSRIVKKKYIPLQSFTIITVIFLATLIPLLPIFSAMGPFYVSLTGSYGSALNRTYMVDYSLYSGLLGGLIVLISPKLNNKLKNLRDGKGISYQGIIIAFSLLFIAGGIIQLLVV